MGSGSPNLVGLRADAIRTQGRVDAGRRILRLVALVAAVLWLIAVVIIFVSQWHELDARGSPSVQVPNLIEENPRVDGWSLMAIAGDSLESTWGYALVAVAAFGASLWFDDSKARDLFELLDEGDDEHDDVDPEALPPPRS
jgi:amino acid transporter